MIDRCKHGRTLVCETCRAIQARDELFEALKDMEHKYVHERANELVSTIEKLQNEVERLQEIALLFNRESTNESIKVLELRNVVDELQKEVERYRRALERITVTFDRMPMVRIAEQALGESHDTI